VRTNVSTLMRGALVVATVLLASSMAGTMRAQEGTSAERVLTDNGVPRFFTPASGALFALKTAYTYGQTVDMLLRPLACFARTLSRCRGRRLRRALHR
jgi:hypothetical protein